MTHQPRPLRIGYLVASVAYMALIAFFSSQPRTEGPLSGLLSLLHQIPGGDKIVHSGEFAVLGLLLERGLGSALLATLTAAAYGVVDEWHQSFVPGRDAVASDALADLVGAAIGAFLIARLLRRRDRSAAA